VSEEYASYWVHQDCHVADEQKAALKKAAGVSGGKDECQVRLKGREHDYWMGTEIGKLAGYGFQGQVTARTTHDARTCTLMPNKSVALSASACQVSLH